MARIDERQVANDWNDTTMYANFSLCLWGEADEWLAYTVRLHELTAAQRTWTRIRPLFKREYGECTTSRRTSCPKRFHEKIFYLSCIFL